MIEVLLNSIPKVQRFAQKIMLFECEIDVVKNRYVVNARSIIGLFTFDLSKPVGLVIHSEDDKEIERFKKEMEEFM